MQIKPIHPAEAFPSVYQGMIGRYGKPKEFSINFLPKLDNKIWGLQRKRLAVVAGRTSNGKSILLLQMAHAFAKQGKRVVFVTLEMTTETCIMRIMNNACGINNWSNIVGISPEQDAVHKKDVNKFSEELKGLQFVIVEGYGKTFKEILDIIETLRNPIDVVFIDYVQMIKNPNKDGIDEYIKQLRNKAIESDFLAVLGSQINRATFDGAKVRKPEIWELKGSGALEEICDVCLLLHWQHHYTLEKDNYNDFWIRVAKNRDGRTGAFDCRIDPEYSRISEKHDDITEESDERNFYESSYSNA